MKELTVEDLKKIKEHLAIISVPKLPRLIVDFGVLDTVKKLKDVLALFPDNMPVNFRNQPAQHLYFDSEFLYYEEPFDIKDFLSSIKSEAGSIPNFRKQN